MDLEKALEGCGFPPEMRPYIPHVTLARKAPLVEAQQPLQPLHWPVEGFVLATSGGQGPGPRYKVLKKWRADS
jgi:2'-5' RNA ligase